MRQKLSRFIGDKAFYKMVMAVAIPIMIQNGITNFVSLLDNIMVGQIGTEQMSGVSIVNQLIFVFNLCVFGGMAGAGIFTAQFYGKGQDEGVRATFRFKVWVGILILFAGLAVLLTMGKTLVLQYLRGSADGGDPALALQYGMDYLRVILFGLPAFVIVQIYADTLRECGETVVPMRAGLVSVMVNLAFNYLLIFGRFGFPQLGVVGAAAATCISRYVEMLIVVIWTHTHAKKHPFVHGLYRTMRIPLSLTGQIIRKGMPLLVNEFLWSSGMAFLTQCYSMRGLGTVAAMNISNTINNVFIIGFLAMGTAVSIIVGQLLGAGKIEEAKATDTRLLFFTVMLSAGLALVMMATAPLFPKLYNTTEEIRALAARLMIVSAAFMPVSAFNNATYFTLRSGGKTMITFLFDSGALWAVTIPTAYILSRFTAIDPVWMMLCVNSTDLIKSLVGYVMVKKGGWAVNMVS